MALSLYHNGSATDSAIPHPLSGRHVLIWIPITNLWLAHGTCYVWSELHTPCSTDSITFITIQDSNCN